MPNGRLMVNCGGTSGATDSIDGTGDPGSSMNGTWIQNSTIKALSKAFPGQVGFLQLKGILFYHFISILAMSNC